MEIEHPFFIKCTLEGIHNEEVEIHLWILLFNITLRIQSLLFE